MWNFEPLFEFSRLNCVAICSFLVPAILITTITTLILVVTNKSEITPPCSLEAAANAKRCRDAPASDGVISDRWSLSKMLWSKRIALILELTLFLHVSTWFMIGVVTPVTFILFGLGSTCLIINSLAVVYRHEIAQLFSTRVISLH